MTDRSEDVELLPCPMCGSSAHVEGVNYHWAICKNDNCMLQTRGYGTASMARDAWNRRAAQSAPVEGDKPIEDCPHCDNDGYTVEQDGFGNPVQAQCEFCYTNPNFRFNRTQPKEG